MEVVLAKLEEISNRLTAIETRIGGASPDEVPIEVTEFDGVIAEYEKSLGLAEIVSSELSTLCSGYLDMLRATRSVIYLAAIHSQPTDDVLEPIMMSFVKIGREIQPSFSVGRRDPLFAHCNALQQIADLLVWPCFPTGTFNQYVNTLPAVEMYGNRVRKLKDPASNDWWKGVLSFLNKLKLYIEDYHKMGLHWGFGSPATLDDLAKISSSGEAQVSEPSKAEVPVEEASIEKPPVEKAPIESETVESKAADAAASASASLADDLAAALSGPRKMRHVKKEETARGRAREEGEGIVTQVGSRKKASAVKKAPAKPPRCELVGNVWHIENQTENITLDDIKMSHAVTIWNCKRCLIDIPKKCRSINVANCQRLQLSFVSVITAVEMLNCKRCEMQPSGSVPMITLESVSDSHIYMSDDARENCVVVTARSSDCNVHYLKEDKEEGVYSIPYQYQHTFAGGEPVTSVVEHAAG